MLRLKIISTNDKKVNFTRYLLRSIILYFPVYYIIKIVGLYTLNATNYHTLSFIFYEIQYYLRWIIILMIIMRTDDRGLHDLVSQTKVAIVDKNGNVLEENTNSNKDNNFSLKKNNKISKKKIVVDTTIDEEDSKKY